MTTYSPTLGDTIYLGATSATEDLSRINGFIAGCGQAALLVILNAVKGQGTAPADVTALIRQAINGGLVTGGLAQSGESSPGNLEALAQQQGVSLQSGDYTTLLAQYAGTKPIIVGVSNASAFGGSDAHVFDHYVTVVGHTLTGNYIVSDPNTPESQVGKFVEYTPAQMNAAKPFWSAVPTGPTLPGLGGFGGFNPLNIILPDWINALGSKFSAFAAIYGAWANPIRVFKLILGTFIIAAVTAIIVFEGATKGIIGAGKISGKVTQQAGDAAKVAAAFIK